MQYEISKCVRFFQLLYLVSAAISRADSSVPGYAKDRHFLAVCWKIILFESFLMQHIGVIFFLHVASRWCISCCFLHKCWRFLSPLCTPTKRAPSLPNDPLTMLREIIALWAIWTLLCPFLRLTVTWLKIFLDEMIDETFIVRLSVISQSKARFDQCKITKTSSRSSEAVSRKTSHVQWEYS